jgi:hypothetical protein
LTFPFYKEEADAPEVQMGLSTLCFLNGKVVMSEGYWETVAD